MNTLPTLTEKQQDILDFINRYLETNSYPPALREIAKKFKFRSVTAVVDHLKALEKKGYIKRGKDLSRALEVLTFKPEFVKDNIVSIPILGSIAAGAPLLAVENLSGTIQIDSTIINADET
ncbi:MAG: hypothetical protein WC838_01655, partial [Candidatus Margulisiibacteriota bacterium]